jgi:hypothetical protein
MRPHRSCRSYCMKLIREYQKSLQKYPNPKAVNMTQFDR